MKTIYFFLLLFIAGDSFAQSAGEKLTKAFQEFEKDDQFSHASIGLYVVNSNTGQIVFDKNGQLGLAPASTQKVITSVAAFELLGKEFRYQTKFALDGVIENNRFSGEFKIIGSGDPSFGSWRWRETGRQQILDTLVTALKRRGVLSINGNLSINSKQWESQATPNGWIWEDIGNYYGAGPSILNWHENSYNLVLQPGSNVGDSVKLLSRTPEIPGVFWKNELLTAKAGSGDNAVIYLPENGFIAYLRGTIPAGVKTFTIKGAMPFPETVFLRQFKNELEQHKIIVHSKFPTVRDEQIFRKVEGLKTYTEISSFLSPSFDSLNYWFMRESINLYGEAFIKTIAFNQKGFGSTQGGIDIVRQLWAGKGLEKSALKIVDGSGLSPANRVTAHALVTVMQYAKKQPWFASFYHALPLQNNIKMKSGSISGVRAYTGYIKSRGLEEYSFAFIINNYDGSAAAVREKMWKLLDLLK